MNIPLALVLTLTAAQARAQFCPLGPTERRIVACRAESTLAQCRSRVQGAACRVVRDLPLIHAVVVEMPSARVSISEARLAAAPEVDRVHKDEKVHWLENLPPLDFPSSEASDITRELRDMTRQRPRAEDPRLPWGVKRVGAPQAWRRTEGAGASIAVIDTGIDASHPDLAGRLAGGVNVLDGRRPDDWQDDEGHGTHVAGTIAADGRGGVLGVAPKAKLYAVKVLDKDGNGNYDDVIAGIQWAVERGIKIANMSLGAEEGNETLRAAVAAAKKAGVTIVAAAGNTGGSVGYPAAYPETVAVGASDSEDRIARFSSRGPQVAFAAPGVDIRSAKLGGGYANLSGTSMAAPHVSGLAALAYSLGARTPAALRAALDRAAHPLAGATPDAEGRGIILAGDLSAGDSALASLR